MDERTQALVAMGASAALNCHPCITHSLAVCDMVGIDREEVKAAIEVGMTVSRGAAARTRTFGEELLGTATQKGGTGSCGCGA